MQYCSISSANALEILQSLWRMETFYALLALCAGNSLVTGEFPSQRSVTWSFDVYFDVSKHKMFNKQLNWQWFEMLWHQVMGIKSSECSLIISQCSYLIIENIFEIIDNTRSTLRVHTSAIPSSRSVKQSSQCHSTRDDVIWKCLVYKIGITFSGWIIQFIFAVETKDFLQNRVNLKVGS